MTNKAIEREIKNIYIKIYNEVFTNKNLSNLIKGSRIEAEKKLIEIQSSDLYDTFAKKFSLALAKKGLSQQRGVWKKYYEAAKRAHYVALPQTYDKFELENLSMAVKHNFEMIKSIPERMMEIFQHKYTSELIEEVAKGTKSRGSFKKLLSEHGVKQAQLIARTETAKLQTAIMKQRSTSLGSVAYIWMSSHDKRTRPSHRNMDGVVVFWREGEEQPHLDGMVGDAGEYPNCRCDTEPIVDLEDLNKTSYKVYDYRNHTIINMTRNKLRESLLNGGLN